MTTLNVNQDKASLYKKVVKVMSQVKRVPKNGWNAFHKYKFVAEADLVEYIRQFMVEEGLVLFNSVTNYEMHNDTAIVTIDFTLCDTDTGESITTTIVAEGQDKGDKKFPKAFASATKYYLMKTFLIPTGDDPEADIRTDQRSYGNRASQNQKQAQTQPQTQQAPSQSMPTASPDLVKLLNQRVVEVSELANNDAKNLVEQLRLRVGEFNKFEDLTIAQAKKVKEILEIWKVNYENRAQES